jgi:pimeloyl-ACP methyl ester carboxylesterase
MRRRFTDTSEGQIHFRSEGSGEPVLLLHQTPRSSDEYLEVIPLIGQEYWAIAMDTIGYGDSYKPNKRCSIEDYAEGVFRFLDALDIHKANIIGHHTGAVIAVELVASHPERFQKLVLSACPYIDEAERKRRAESKMRVDAYELKEDGSHLLDLWQGRMSFYPKSRPDLLIRFMIDALKAGDKVEEGHEACNMYKMETRIPLIKCPTLLTCGTSDPFSYPHMKTLSKVIQGSILKPIEGGTVALVDQMPKVFADVVLNFLRG